MRSCCGVGCLHLLRSGVVIRFSGAPQRTIRPMAPRPRKVDGLRCLAGVRPTDWLRRRGRG